QLLTSISAGLPGPAVITNSSSTAATLTVRNPVADVYSGVLSRNLSLVKASVGRTLTISGTSNSYHSTTTVTAGTLANGAVNALPTTTALTVNTGGTYDLSGSNQQVASIAGQGTITNSDVSISATLTVSNAAADIFDGSLTGTVLGLTKINT